MKILNGKKLAGKILNNLKKKIKKKQLKLTLAVVLIGDNPACKAFARQKEDACEKTGIKFELFDFSGLISQKDLEKKIKELAKDKNVSGIVIELPLPKKIDSKEILNLIPSEKDIDVLSEKTFEKFKAGKLKILPPVVCAISHILDGYKISLRGKNLVLVGKGKLTGLPLSIWLSRKKINFSVVDKTTKTSASLIKKADILISGVGKPNLIKTNMVKKGVVVIDIGVSRQKGKLVGDVDFQKVSKKAKFITPVPGGIGPLTIACLLENLVKSK